jgi:hypothetical protein
MLWLFLAGIATLMMVGHVGKNAKGRARTLLALVALTSFIPIIAAVATWVFGAADPEKSDDPVELQKAIGQIQMVDQSAVVRYADGLHIGIETDPEDHISSVGYLAKNVVEAIGKRTKIPISEMKIRLIIPTVNRFGKEGTGEGGTFTLWKDDLARIDWEAISNERLLDLMDASLMPIAVPMAVKFCKNRDTTPIYGDEGFTPICPLGR